MTNKNSNKVLLYIVNVDSFFVSHRLGIAKKAIAEGYDVHLACHFTTYMKDLEFYGIKVHEVNFDRSSTAILPEIKTFLRLTSVIMSVRPSVLHLITIKPVLYAGIVARVLSINTILAISGLGYIFMHDNNKTSVLRNFLIVLYRFVCQGEKSRTIVQNPTDMEFVSRVLKVKQHKLFLIDGSGVDLSEYRCIPEPDSSTIRIAMASRLLKDKGVCEYVDAARLLAERGVSTHFVLAGIPDPGNPSSVSYSYYENIKKEGYVECIGFCDDISTLFAGCNIVVLPSYREGLPKVLIEAAACGRPVVTTDVPGCRDAVIPGVTGLLIPIQSAEAIADAVEILTLNKTMRVLMGNNGRKMAEERFDVLKIIEQHLELYKNI